MKFRKSLILLATLVFVFALSIPAFAANIVELGKPNKANGEQQKGWEAGGNASVEDFVNAKFLVLELAEPPVGGAQIIWQGDADWTWNQTDGVIPGEGTDETTIVIDLTKKLKNYSAFTKCENTVHIFIGYYSDKFDDLKIERAYFTDEDPTKAAKPAAKPAVKEEAPAVVEDNEPVAEAVAEEPVASNNLQELDDIVISKSTKTSCKNTTVIFDANYGLLIVSGGNLQKVTDNGNGTATIVTGGASATVRFDGVRLSQIIKPVDVE